MKRKFREVSRRTEISRKFLVYVARRSQKYIQRQGWIPAFASALLDVAGFCFLTWAGFQLNSVAGLVIAGFSCFVLAQKVKTRLQPNG